MQRYEPASGINACRDMSLLAYQCMQRYGEQLCAYWHVDVGAEILSLTPCVMECRCGSRGLVTDSVSVGMQAVEMTSLLPASSPVRIFFWLEAVPIQDVGGAIGRNAACI